MLLACGPAPTYFCISDAQCGAQGACEPDGGCSFPDAQCESGRRFAEFTPAGDVCVPVEDLGSTSSTTSTEPASATLEPDGSSSGTTAVASTTTSSSTGVATSGSSSTGDADAGSSEESSSGGPAKHDFFDDFERPDSDDVGNGWIEKSPESFALIDGGIRRVDTTSGYPDNLVYRPQDEWLDAEVTLELTWLNIEGDLGSPQCGLRIQAKDIDTPGSVTGYLLFIHGTTGNLTITRQIAGSFSADYVQPMTAPVEEGPLYRLRFDVSGSDPVVLDGYLEQFVDDAWGPHSEVHAMDDGAERIAGPGTLMVGGHIETGHWTYEAVTLKSFDGGI